MSVVTQVYKNPDGTYGYTGSTVKYASSGAAQYYGSRDASEYSETSTRYTGSPAGTYVKEYSSSGKPLSYYGVDSKTGTISQEKLEKLKTGYLSDQLKNLGKQRPHKIRTHVITDEEARERGISKVFGGKDYTKERRAERKVANKIARKEAGPAKPYAITGSSRYFNPYGGGDFDPGFVLQSEYDIKDIRQSKLTIMEIGEGGQYNYGPKTAQLQEQAAQRRNVTSQLKAYTLLHGNQGQVSLLAVQAQAENERIRNEKLNQSTQVSTGPQVTAKDIAQQIIREAQQKGATKINLYEGKEVVGSIPINKSTQTTIELFLKNQNEISYSFSNPAKYKAEHANTKQQSKDFKNYVIGLQKQGAEIEIRDKSGNLITTVKQNGPVLYEITKASKQYGEVNVTPKYSIETVVKSFSKTPEEPSTSKINIGFGLDIPVPGEVTGFVKGAKSGAKSMIASFLGPGILGDTSFGTQKYVEPYRQKLESETAFGNLINLQPSTKPLSYQIGTAAFDIGIAVTGLKGFKGGTKIFRSNEPPTSGRIYKPIRTPSTIKIIKGFKEGQIQHEIITTKNYVELYQGTEVQRTPGSVSEKLEPVKPYLARTGRKVRTIISKLPPIATKTKNIIGIGSKGEKVIIKGEPKVKVPGAETSGEAQLPYVKVVKSGPTTIVRSGPQKELPINAIYAEDITPGQAVSLGLEEVKGLKGVYYAKATPHVQAHLGTALKSEELTTGTDIFKFGKGITAKNAKVYAEISKNPELIKGNKYPEIIRPFVVRTFIGKSPGGFALKNIKKLSTVSKKFSRPFKTSDFTNIGIGKVSAGAAARAVSLLESPTKTINLPTKLTTKTTTVTKPKIIPRDYLGLSSQDAELGKYLIGKSNYEFTIETLAYPGNVELPTRSDTTIASIRNSANKEMNRIKNLTRRSLKGKQKQFPETVQSQRSNLAQVQANIVTERSDLLTKLLTNTKQKNPFKQREPIKTKEKPFVIVSPIEIVGQKGKQVQIIKEIQKQLQTQKLKIIEQPKPPKFPEVFGTLKPPKLPNLELKAQKEARKRTAKQANRADFIGNASEISFEGLYKRSEITYGQKKIKKITAKDIKLNLKGVRRFTQLPKHGKLTYPVRTKKVKKTTKSSYRSLLK